MRERKRITFLKDIRHMMYGYGDSKSSRYDTAEVLEAYTMDYLRTLLTNTLNMAQNKGKTKTEDLLVMLQRDRRKHTRVKDLLATNEDLKNARKLIDFEEYEKET